VKFSLEGSKYELVIISACTDVKSGQAEMKQAPIKNLQQLNFTCLLQKNVSDF
jgi:hypothetical protein